MSIISEDQKKKLLKKYGINEKQLPRIKSSDPETKSLGAKAGDIIKIDRNDITGKYSFYRIVEG